MNIRRDKILIAEPKDFSCEAMDLLAQYGEVVLNSPEPAGLQSALADADVLWVRLRYKIDRALLAHAPRLRIIASPTTGLNHIDLDEAARRGIRVVSLRGAQDFLRGVRATAEHTIGLMLALLRHIPQADRHVRSGRWERDLFKGSELFGKTVGVVGYGRLGRIVARYLSAFDASVLASDPNVTAAEAGPDVHLVPLPQLLAGADLVTLHVNLNRETADLFGSTEFAAMKQGARLVNTSRGELIDETALLNALRSGRLAGAALDVLCNENGAIQRKHPLIDYARRHGNLIITPHLGGCTRESLCKTEIFLAQQLVSVLSQEDVEAHAPVLQTATA